MGDEPVGIYYRGYDSDPMGVLDVGPEIEGGDDVFEAFTSCRGEVNNGGGKW